MPEQQHFLLAKLSDVEGLPSPPQVAFRIVEVTRDPEKGLNELTEILQVDTALAAKVLRISNSASYARGCEVATLCDAVNLLGAKSVSIIALSFSLKKAMQSFQLAAGLDDTLVWQNSVATGVASRALSRLVGNSNTETAFLCGMMSRIGQLVLSALLPDEYQPALSIAKDRLPTAAEEQSALGITHHQVGRLLLEKWQLPALICDVVEHWGNAANQDLSPAAHQLAEIVEVADAFRGLLFDENKAQGLQSLHTKSRDLFGIPENQIDRLFLSCQRELEETLSIFDQSTDEVNCEQILLSAREQLVQVSLDLATNLTVARHEADTLAISNQELRKRSSTDALTKLPNRYALDQELSALDEVGSNAKRKRAYSIVMLDIDHFKKFNDTYGHLAGDQVLQSVADSLAECSRATDFVARYGGEEFTVILTNCGEAEAVSVANRFRTAIERRGVELEDGTVFVTASLGVASSDSFVNGTSHHEILQCADTALYRAKEDGRNCVVQQRIPISHVKA